VPMTWSEDEVRGAVATCDPALAAAAAEAVGEGMDSVVWRLGGSWIFRFPRFAEVSANLDVEVRVLPRLASRCAVALPRFEYVGRWQGLTFVGYRAIEGVELTPVRLARLGRGSADERRTRAAVVASLGRFFDAVHEFPTDEAVELGVTRRDLRQAYADDLALAEAVVFPELSPVGRRTVRQIYEAYLTEDDFFEYEPCLLHADVSAEHLLVDEAGHLVGVIDFGDLVVSDPAYDLMFLYEEFGADVVSELVASTRTDWGLRLFDKLHFWFQANFVADVLIHHRRGDGAERQWALGVLNERLG